MGHGGLVSIARDWYAPEITRKRLALDEADTSRTRHSVETPKTEMPMTLHQEEFETTRRATDDETKDGLDWAEITENYIQEHGYHKRRENRDNRYRMPWRRQRSKENKSNTQTKSTQ